MFYIVQYNSEFSKKSQQDFKGKRSKLWNKTYIIYFYDIIFLNKTITGIHQLKFRCVGEAELLLPNKMSNFQLISKFKFINMT